MQLKRTQKPYHIRLLYPNTASRTVIVKATSKEIAERRALKRNPGSIGIDRGKDVA